MNLHDESPLGDYIFVAEMMLGTRQLDTKLQAMLVLADERARKLGSSLKSRQAIAVIIAAWEATCAH